MFSVGADHGTGDTRGEDILIEAGSMRLPAIGENVHGRNYESVGFFRQEL